MFKPVVRPLVRATAQTSIANRGRASLSAQVAALFAAGMKGIWRESSVISTLYQDNLASSPVVAPANPIGFVASKDQALARGVEAWSAPVASVDWTINGDGSYTHTPGATGTVRVLAPAGSPAIGKFYEVFYTVTGRTAGTVSPLVGSASGGPVVSVNGPQHAIVAMGGNTVLYFVPSSVFDGTVSAVSFREFLGNHQLQATTQSRPLYQVGPPRPVFDGIDDVLNTTFAAALGTNCTVGRYVPGTGVVILTGQNIGTTFADSVTSGPLVVLDGPLNAGQTATLAAYLTQQGTLP